MLSPTPKVSEHGPSKRIRIGQRFVLLACLLRYGGALIILGSIDCGRYLGVPHPWSTVTGR